MRGLSHDVTHILSCKHYLDMDWIGLDWIEGCMPFSIIKSLFRLIVGLLYPKLLGLGSTILTIGPMPFMSYINFTPPLLLVKSPYILVFKPVLSLHNGASFSPHQF